MLSVYLLLPCARAMGARMRRMMLSMIVSIMREKIQRRWIAPCGSKRGVFTEARSTCDRWQIRGGREETLIIES